MNALVVVNTNDFMHPKCRETIQAAVSRWACDYIEVHGGEHIASPSVLKIEAASRMRGYNAIAVMDADVFVSKSCPPPFDIIKSPNAFYAVSDVQQPGGQSERWRKEVYLDPLFRASSRLGLLWRHSEGDFFNSGLFVFRNTFFMESILKECVAAMPKPCSLLDEQATFNLMMRYIGTEILLVDSKWNYVVHPDGINRDAYINHFAGEAKRFIEGAIWT